MSEATQRELERRMALWRQLTDMGGPGGVSPRLLRQLRIYGGAQGIWVDKARTGALSTAGTGVAISLLHTGRHYADDLSSDGILYHYPQTGRPAARDKMEIEATKEAANLGLPVFVLTRPTPASSSRDVRLGWIEAWDDASQLFLITFGESAPSRLAQVREDEPFYLTGLAERATRTAVPRDGQQRFKFRVFQRYGAECVVCGITLLEVLDAAHVRPVRLKGSDDPRNGLVLCALHHRALDAGLFAIEPGTLRVRYRSRGPGAAELRVTRPDIGHLPRPPHPQAIEWFWRRWKG